MAEEKCLKWFLMRAAYGQEKKAESILTGIEGIDEVFIPQYTKVVSRNGERKKIQVSMIPNTLFVKSTEDVLHQYIGKGMLTFFHHYYKPNKDLSGREIGTGRTPIVIPEYQMKSFRTWVEASADDKLYRITPYVFKDNDLVKIVDGDFKGFVGRVVRLKGQTRVGINIDGVGFISTTYIPKNFLEKIDNIQG